MIVDFLKKLVKKNSTVYRHAKTSYSQEGEDMILNRFFEHKKEGIYVDVGAHHPYRFSNTCFFYKKGWHGINIDPLPQAASLFKKYRKRDINIQKGISLKAEQLIYYAFNEPAYNTFSETKANEYIQQANLNLKLLSKTKIDTVPLQDVLDNNIPPGATIDFLTIDTEGLEMEVLQSNNWEKYKPTIIILESHVIEIENHLSSPLHLFMKNKDYILVGKSYYSYLYKKKEL
ncbi:MAG: FkbM family methyltransferase [Ferruginibacter sp.]|nr:FkbM family methyltransferase [Ferruginibacter sp.]